MIAKREKVQASMITTIVERPTARLLMTDTCHYLLHREFNLTVKDECYGCKNHKSEVKYHGCYSNKEELIAMYGKQVFSNLTVGDIWNEFTRVCVIFDVVNTLNVKDLITFF